MKRELIILHCPAGGGHKAAALAIAEEAATRGVAARVLDVLSFTPAWFARLYVDTHLKSSAHLPGIYGGAYFALNHRGPSHGELKRHIDAGMAWIAGSLLREVQSLDPLAVVTTHFFPMALLGGARKKGELSAPLIEVVTDYAAHAFWAEPGADAYCAPAGRACNDLVRHGIDPRHVVPTGIPVRAAFAAIPPARPRERGQPLRVLITSGGFGVGPVLRVLRSFAGIPAVELTVVCGQNPDLVSRVRHASEKFGLGARVIGFEPHMNERIADAHVVVTKPGGLTVTECLVAGRPLLLVGAVPGQESLNEAWVTQSGAGIGVAARSVGGAAAALAENGELARMAERARGLAARDAASSILRLALARARDLAA